MFEVEDIKEIQIDLASVCNCRCKFCYRTYYKLKDVVYIDMDVIDKILDECVNLERLNICGNTGEFVFHPQIFEIIEKVKNRGVVLDIYTNGGMYGVEWWKKLCGYMGPEDMITFSIDGLEDTHSRYRGTKYEKVIENMKTCISCGVGVSWQFIVFGYNEHQVEEAERRCYEYGCKVFRKINSRKYDDEYPAPSDYIEYEKCGDVVMCKFLMNRKVYVDYNGIVNPCCYFSTSLDDESILRKYILNRNKMDLKKNSFKSVMQNELIQYFFNNQKEIKRCRLRCCANKQPKLSLRKMINKYRKGLDKKSINN